MLKALADDLLKVYSVAVPLLLLDDRFRLYYRFLSKFSSFSFLYRNSEHYCTGRMFKIKRRRYHTVVSLKHIMPSEI